MGTNSLNAFYSGAEFLRIGYKDHCRVRLWLDEDDHNLSVSPVGDSDPIKETIPLKNMDEIRYGFSTDVFYEATRKSSPSIELDESRCFSIVYDGRKQSLDLQTADESTGCVLHWYRGLKYLVESLKMHRDLNAFLLDKFRQADGDRSRALNFRETWQVVRSMNIHLPRKQVLISKISTTFS